MANYKNQFMDAVNRMNKIAHVVIGGSAKEWATRAANAGIITYEGCVKIKRLVDLGGEMSHGNSKYINVGINEINSVNHYCQIMSNTANRLKRGDAKKGKIRLPNGTFRYVKELRLEGNNHKTYYFKFHIVEEYQKRAYNDGNRFSGTGYTIYVVDAPYKQWCQANDEFHYYNIPWDRPSICWNSRITDFSDANAVMVTWAKRYVKLLVSYIQSGELNEFSAHHRVKNKGILPTGTFRFRIRRRNTSKKAFVKPSISVTEEVYQQILSTIGTLKPEKGGMLGSSDGVVIDSFVFDEEADTKLAEYSPNTDFLNQVLEEEWSDIYFKGFVHSHPFNGAALSSADIEYAIRIMDAASMSELFMPIVNSTIGGEFKIYGYIVKSNGNVVPCNIKRVETNYIDDFDPYSESSLSEEEIMKRFALDFLPVDEPSRNLFSRVDGVLNIDFLKQCTIIGVGCGGAREFYLDMARVGVGNFFLMDADTVAPQNIASQNVYIDEVGLPKTDAIKHNILRINPQADVVSITQMLDNTKDDEWFETELLSKCNKGGNVLLCAFTDNFDAQARLSRLAIKYSLPFISAQHHERGETSEIIFWYPGITPYCQKEILKNRYESYQNGYKNTVTSVGSPIFNTSRLNSICTKLATGMLLYKDDEYNLYSMFLTLKPTNNLLIIRQNSLLNSSSALAQLFISDEIGYFFDDVVWVDVGEICDYDDACECRAEIADTRK